MQVNIEDLGSCKKKLTIEIPVEKVAEELDKRTGEYMNSAELPGFRRGHIPSKLFERRFGKKLREAVRNDLTAEAFEEVLKEHNLEPLGEPEIPGIEELELNRENPLKFEVELVVKPQVKVDDYTGIKVQAEEIKVTDEEIEQAIEQMRKERGELVVVEDRPSGAQDMLMVDVEVSVEGQVIHSSQNSYIGTDSKGIFGVEIPDMAEKLSGRKRGETVEQEFELPKSSALEYGEELVGKQARCSLKINEIKTLKIPEAVDSWAKEMGFESFDELKEEVRKQITGGKERGTNKYVEKKILDKLLDICGFEVPKEMIEARAHELTEYRRYQLMKAGVEAEKIDADLDSYKDLSRQEIERNFREDIVLGKIAELENLFVTEDEVDGAITQIAFSRGQAPDQLREEMDNRGLVSRLRADLLESRVKEFLREKAEIETLPFGSLSKDQKPEDTGGEEEQEPEIKEEEAESKEKQEKEK